MPKKKGVELKGTDNFYRDLFRNFLTTKTHLDTKINWLLGISGLIMSLSMQYLFKVDIPLFQFGLFVIMISSFIAFIASLVNLDIPDWMLRKVPPAMNNLMFYHCHIGKSVDEIIASFKSIKTEEDILAQYAINCHNLANRKLSFNSRLFKMSRDILLTGLIIGMTFVISAALV